MLQILIESAEREFYPGNLPAGEPLSCPVGRCPLAAADT